MSEVKEGMVHLLDLPDELLITIFNKLKPTDLFWSMMDVNKRLDEISRDCHFTTQPIDLTATGILDQLCSNILPRIQHDVTWLIIQSADIKRVLLAAKYPNLTSLTLLNLGAEEITQYFLRESKVSCIFQNQIKKLVLQGLFGSALKNSTMCNQILTSCINLTRLAYYSNNPLRMSESYFFKQCSSLILIELNTNVFYFSDCLFLLDGRLPQLKIFRIEIKNIEITPSGSIDVAQVIPLLNMKIFSLICYRSISMYTYENWILSLLHRMSNLEKLSLWLTIEGNRFLTGIDLDKQIVSSLPQLLIFTYFISTGIRVNHEAQLQNDDIQRTFPIGKYNQFRASCSTLSFPGGSRFCYIISQPYTLNRLDYINQNNFPTGIFTTVRHLMLCTNNQQAFEHEFFLQISRSFPFLERLYIIGREAQLFRNSIFIPVEFLRLKMLIFPDDIHLDYVEQFLFGRKTHLPNLQELQINYEDLSAITNAFTDTEALVNCARVAYLYLNKQIVRTYAFDLYFPSLSTLYQCVKPLWSRH